ncbi:SH3 domain-containing protein [Yinghuangia seranimata]|uniref:SH3 domain-containing protein n=1 Tax=Yinghuangia seranimata TaxID=408067 RepID=UPI00248CF35D|nr:SH3 domain-containing protein [Yinghuangia seranimata]MDI2124906.1 SH3 domain-containing protein [Yinghuangia seranimata]
MHSHKERFDYRGRDSVVVYVPRRTTSGGAWIGLAAVVLAIVAGGTTDVGAGSSGVPAVVHSPGGLALRTQADEASGAVGQLADNTTVTLACKVDGRAVVGRTGTADTTWYRVTKQGATGYVPGAWLSLHGADTLVHACSGA